MSRRAPQILRAAAGRSRAARVAANESSSRQHIPYIRKVDPWTLETRSGDLIQGQADVAGRPDERKAPQHAAFVAALVSRRPRGPDEPFAFVKAQRGRGEATASGDVAHGEMVGSLHGYRTPLT